MDLESADYWRSLINMGLTKFLIVHTLHEQPSHGYAILEKLRQFSRDCCTPTYGGIYPVLKQLVEGDYAAVRSETDRGRKRLVYELTEKGTRAYLAAVGAWHDVVPLVAGIVSESQR